MRKYIYIKVKNDAGVVNRVSSLFRKRNYNIEEFSVDFSSDGSAGIVIAVSGNLDFLNQVMNQIDKLYDVLEVYEIEDRNNICYTFCVKCRECNFDDFIHKPIKIIEGKNISKAVFFIELDKYEKFKNKLIEKGFEYRESLINLI